jgi:hypothetical protein
MSRGYEPNRVLLPASPFLYFSEHRAGTSGHHLPFLLQELIGYGVSDVVVRDHDLSFIYKEVTPTLATILKNRIRPFNNDKSRRITLDLFSHFFEEFGIEPGPSLQSFVLRHNSSDLDHTIGPGIILTQTVRYFIDCINARAQCEIDLVRTVRFIDRLTEASRSPDMLANLAVLKAVFTNYSKISHAALECKFNTSTGIANIFEELVHDAAYTSLSAELHMFGVKQDISALMTRVKRLVKDILQSKLGKHFLDYGSRVVSVYTGVPVPTSDLAMAFMQTTYFPPVIDLSKATVAAGKKLARSEKDMRFIGPGISD